MIIDIVYGISCALAGTMVGIFFCEVVHPFIGIILILLFIAASFAISLNCFYICLITLILIALYLYIRNKMMEY